MSKLKGKFIVLDGGDGCGKSTQAKMLAGRIISQGVEVVSYRDPGTTVIGEKIRDILLNPDHVAMDTRTECLLYMASRAQLWAEHIKSDIAAEKCVLLDRWLSSTCAYQGYAGGFGIEQVIDVAAHSLERIWPDLTIILDVDLKTAAMRMNRRLDRMEQKGAEYHEKVRRGFLELTKIAPNFHIVNAGQDVDYVHRAIIEIIKNLPDRPTG